jgi:hypothetical protein
LELAKNLVPDKFIFAVDPGMLTGICIMETNGFVRAIGNHPIDDIYEMLDKDFAKDIQLVVMEDFVVGDRAAYLKGSKNEASQVIGIVNAWARKYKIPVVMQMSGIKTIAEKMSGKRPRGAHRENHWLDAFNHGYYFLHSVGLIKVRPR